MHSSQREQGRDRDSPRSRASIADDEETDPVLSHSLLGLSAEALQSAFEDLPQVGAVQPLGRGQIEGDLEETRTPGEDAAGVLRVGGDHRRLAGHATEESHVGEGEDRLLQPEAVGLGGTGLQDVGLGTDWTGLDGGRGEVRYLVSFFDNQ